MKNAIPTVLLYTPRPRPLWTMLKTKDQHQDLWNVLTTAVSGLIFHIYK